MSVVRVREEECPSIDELYQLLVSKSRRVFNYFKRYSDGRNYNRFRRLSPTSKNTEVKKIGDYIILRTLKYSTRLSKYFYAIGVIGIDETTGRLFCNIPPVSSKFNKPDFLKTLTLAEVRRIMGFDKEYSEELYEGETLRLQGDITITLNKSFSNVSDLINYLQLKVKDIMSREALNHMYSRLNRLVMYCEESLDAEYNKDLVKERLADYIYALLDQLGLLDRFIVSMGDITVNVDFSKSVYDRDELINYELNKCRDRCEGILGYITFLATIYGRKLPSEIVKRIRIILDTLKCGCSSVIRDLIVEFCKEYNIDVPIGVNNIKTRRRLDRVIKKIRVALEEKIECDEEIKRKSKLIVKGFIQVEHKYSIQVGNHTLNFIGVIIPFRVFEDLNRDFTFPLEAIILRPQVLTIKHPEHGVKEIYIPKPCIISIGTLRRRF